MDASARSTVSSLESTDLKQRTVYLLGDAVETRRNPRGVRLGLSGPPPQTPDTKSACPGVL